MRKITAFLLAVAMVFSLAATAFAATVTPELSATTVASGGDVTVTLKLDEKLTGIGNFEYRLYFDPNLFVLKSSENGVANEDTKITKKAKTDAIGTYYGISFVDADSEGQDVNAGVIYTLVFTALQDLTEEQTAAFKLTRKFMKTVTDAGLVEVDEGNVTAGEISIIVTPGAPEAGKYAVSISDGITNGTVTADKSTAAWSILPWTPIIGFTDNWER